MPGVRERARVLGSSSHTQRDWTCLACLLLPRRALQIEVVYTDGRSVETRTTSSRTYILCIYNMHVVIVASLFYFLYV